MKKTMLAGFLGFLGLALSLSACAHKSGAADDNADGNEAAASAAQTSRFEEMVTAPITSQDPQQAASALAAAQWWPAGCATRQRDATSPTVVHVHLDECTGPFGLRHHTGDITITFSRNADGTLHAHAESVNMVVNGHAVTYARDKDITIAGATRTVRSTGSWTRENARGETVAHSATLTTVVDTSTRCRTSNGSAKTTVEAREVDSEIKDYKVCMAEDGSESCPSGTITHSHKITGRTWTVEFDGTATAKVTGPRGGTADFPLVCGG